MLAGPDEPLIVVQDVLGWAPGLRLVGAETGLDRPVRWAQATDLPDPSPCAGSVRECGRRMYLHPNSVRKRIGRIRAVTGRDPADPADLAALTVALTYAEGRAARA
ncbi:helix-turn-helix domain-containing protein [Pseudonocardia sp. NPDC046786]|uniref:PucR family transcriptional regulator n=1 Tax=Pseudonocardia sp. NPDC046786 TaxID=3155471 RepID=UPI0033FC8611